MPYKKIEDLPDAVRAHLPKSAQKMFLEVFNHASEQYDEPTCFKVAWAAVKKKYLKKGERWVKKP